MPIRKKSLLQITLSNLSRSWEKLICAQGNPIRTYKNKMLAMAKNLSRMLSTQSISLSLGCDSNVTMSSIPRNSRMRAQSYSRILTPMGMDNTNSMRTKERSTTLTRAKRARTTNRSLRTDHTIWH